MMTTAAVDIVFVVLCALSTWFPYFGGAAAYSYLPLNVALDAPWFVATSLAILLLAVPFALDTLLDAVTSVLDPRIHVDTILLLPERAVVLAGLVIPCAAAFMAPCCASSLYFVCSQECGRVAVFGALWCAWSRQCGRGFPRSLLWVGMVLWTLGGNLATASWAASGTYAAASGALRIVGGGALYVNMGGWLLVTAHSSLRKAYRGGDLGALYRFVFVGLTLVCLAPAMVGAWVAGDAASYTKAEMTAVQVGYLLFELQLLVFFMRKAKQDGTTFMVTNVFRVPLCMYVCFSIACTPIEDSSPLPNLFEKKRGRWWKPRSRTVATWRTSCARP